MKRSILLPLATLAISTLGMGIAAVSAKPVTYELPDETAAFKPGPNLETVQGNCGACHSADYIATQPQGPAFKKAFWEAEVTKMIKAYGAPVSDADAAVIVDYLKKNYGS